MKTAAMLGESGAARKHRADSSAFRVGEPGAENGPAYCQTAAAAHVTHVPLSGSEAWW